MAGMVGPVLLSHTHQMLHSYATTIITFIIVDMVALFVSFWVQRDILKIKKQVFEK